MSELILSQTDNEETKQKISWLLRSISQELMEADEKAIQEHLATSEHTYYEFATPRKAFSLKARSQRMIKLGS